MKVYLVDYGLSEDARFDLPVYATLGKARASLRRRGFTLKDTDSVETWSRPSRSRFEDLAFVMPRTVRS